MADLTQLTSCKLCPLHATRTHVVVGKGNEHAKILFVGEAPGHNEDIQGKPFVGAAGRELDKLLSRIGLSLEEAYITNIVKCRPPENRDPSTQEIKTCSPYLVEQIIAIGPTIICTLGNYSTKFVLACCDTEKMKQIEGITKLHGKEQKVLFRGQEFIVVPLYHPAAMLYNPTLRADMEKDFDLLGNILERSGQAKKRTIIKISDFT